MATVKLGSPAGKWVMVATILASAMAFIDSTALNVVLPALQKSLQATAADLFWILNAYLLMLAALILVGGSLGDKLGRKKVFMIGIGIFITASTACGLAPDTGYLIAFRIVQGIGGAFMIPGSLSLLSSSIDEKERGKAIGTWSAITTIVTMGGPILGGALADAGLWRYIFFINVPIGIGALLILWRKVAESKETPDGPPSSSAPDSPNSPLSPPGIKSPSAPNARIDIPGAVTIALGLAALTYGFLKMPTLGFSHWTVSSSLALGALMLTSFIIIEAKSPHPMMPLKLFKTGVFAGVNLLTFFLYAGLSASMLFLSLDLVQVQGYSQLQSGLTFLPFTVLMVTIARFAGSLADKWGPRLFLIGGPALAGCGMLILSMVQRTAGPSAYWTTFLPGVLVFGTGMSFTVAPLTTTVMTAVSDQYSGTASGINNALTRVANVFANAIFGALAVTLFTGALGRHLQNIGLPAGTTQPIRLSPEIRQQVLAQSADLGNAHVPASVSSESKPAVEAAYKNAFIYAYQQIMRLAAALAFAGAVMGLLFIKRKHPASSPAP